MKKILIMIFGALTVAFYSCDDDTDRIDDPIEGEPVVLNYDFDSDDEGWNAGLAGYPIDDEGLYDFEVEATTSPADDEDGVVLLSTSNPGEDNLLMFVNKQVTGLEPNTRYDVSYTIELIPNVVIDTTGLDIDTTGLGTDTVGFVDTVNDTVTIKAGAVSEEPETEADELDFLQLIGIDVGEPGVDGSDLIVIGSFASDTTDTGFVQQTVSTETPISAMTNDDGDLWLLIGAESFGSRTEIYINNIEVEIDR